MSNPLDLTNVKVSETFPRLVQIATGAFYDGLGNPITFPPGITGPTGSTGPNGSSLSTFYSAGPGGDPIIIPGSVTLNSGSDVVNSAEYFNSTDCGIYFQSKLPSVNSGDQIYLGLYLYGGGLTYYGILTDNSGPYIEIYSDITLVASGNYNPGDLFNIYLDGLYVHYNLGSGSYLSSQNINGRFAATLMPTLFSGSPLTFTQFLYYPTGKIGPTGPAGSGAISGTGSLNAIPKFNSPTTVADSSISDTGSLVIINSNTQINGFLYLNSNLQTGISGGTATITTIPKNSGKAAFFDYWVSDGTNMRCGTVMSIWDSLGNTKFTDVSSGDLNGTTKPLVFNVDVSGMEVRLLAIPTSGVWDIKSSVRVL